MSDLTKQQAADALGYSVRTVSRWIQDGLLDAYQPSEGGSVRIEESALRKFRDHHKIKPKETA